MSYRVKVSRRAARQIRAASTWWLENREKAPFAFSEDLDDALRLIAEVPGAGQPAQSTAVPSARRLLLSRTQHLLYYSVDQSSRAIEVLVLWDASRGGAPRL